MSVNVNLKIFQNPYGFSCNVYVLSSKKGTILIDPGFYVPEIRRYLNESGGLDAILVTHGHWDHINGLDEVVEEYPDARVYHHELDAEFPYVPRLNCSPGMGFRLSCITEMEQLQEGSAAIAGYEVQVIHLPGHTVGCCAYLFPKENICFTGDAVPFGMRSQQGVPVADETELRRSFEKFKGMECPADMMVYRGHGDGSFYERLLNLKVTDE